MKSKRIWLEGMERSNSCIIVSPTACGADVTCRDCHRSITWGFSTTDDWGVKKDKKRKAAALKKLKKIIDTFQEVYDHIQES